MTARYCGVVVDEPIPRELLFSRVFNFRDLGGYQTQAGRTVRWRRLFRSDTLGGLAEPDKERFDRLGVRTVVDIRRQHEIEKYGRVPLWDGVGYQHVNLVHRDWAETPYQDDDDPARYLAERYRDLAEQAATGLAEAIGVIADERAAPVVVHCMAGKDRTGVVCALTLSLLGVADADIDADYARSTAGNRRFVEWAQANGQPEMVMLPWYESPPGTMVQFLAELRERYGSVRSYLTGAGLDPEQITALRAHLLT